MNANVEVSYNRWRKLYQRIPRGICKSLDNENVRYCPLEKQLTYLAVSSGGEPVVRRVRRQIDVYHCPPLPPTGDLTQLISNKDDLQQAALQDSRLSSVTSSYGFGYHSRTIMFSYNSKSRWIPILSVALPIVKASA